MKAANLAEQGKEAKTPEEAHDLGDVLVPSQAINPQRP